MQVRFELPPCVDSPLARLDPRWRLAGLTLALWHRRDPFAARIPGRTSRLSLTLAALARPPRRWLVARFIPLAVVVAVFVLPMPSLPRRLARRDCEAAVLLLKGASLFLLASVLPASGSVESTLAAAANLGVPRLLIHITQMSLRDCSCWERNWPDSDRLASPGISNLGDVCSYQTVAAATGMLLVRGNAGAVRRCSGHALSWISWPVLHAGRKHNLASRRPLLVALLVASLARGRRRFLADAPGRG